MRVTLLCGSSAVQKFFAERRFAATVQRFLQQLHKSINKLTLGLLRHSGGVGRGEMLIDVVVVGQIIRQFAVL